MKVLFVVSKTERAFGQSFLRECEATEQCSCSGVPIYSSLPSIWDGNERWAIHTRMLIASDSVCNQNHLFAAAESTSFHQNYLSFRGHQKNIRCLTMQSSHRC